MIWKRKVPTEPTVSSESTPIVSLDTFTQKDAEHIRSDVSNGQSNRAPSASKMQASILELCRLLSYKTSDGAFEAEKWGTQLESYLSNSDGRLMYSSISNYIFNKNEEELTTFETNLDSVLHYVEYKLSKSPEDEHSKKLFKAVLKFYDHSNLAIQQQKLVNKKRLDLEHEVECILTPKIPEITKDMTSQLVGLVSIFTALSFIIFGGISSLDSIFTSMQGTLNEQHSILPILVTAIAWALCLMNLLFGFMYFILQITHLPKPINENAHNIVQRYTVVFLCNYILFAFLILFSGMWFAERNGIGKKFFNLVVINGSEFTFWIFLILFSVFFFLLGLFLLNLYHRKRTL